MTIFMAVLKELILKKLEKLAKLEDKKSKSSMNNKVLSADQFEHVEHLKATIVAYAEQFKGDDEKACIDIMKIILAKMIELQTVREGHNSKKEEGVVQGTLTALHKNVGVFLQKLQEFRKPSVSLASKNKVTIAGFNLLDRPYLEKNPISVLYYHCARYLATDIFSPPKNTGNVPTRTKKEQAWSAKLKTLDDKTRKDGVCATQKNDSLTALEELQSANKIANQENPAREWSMYIPSLSFGSMTFAVPNFMGDRMSYELDKAASKIKKITSANFQAFSTKAVAHESAALNVASMLKASSAKPAAKSHSGFATSSAACSPMPPMLSASSGSAGTNVKPPAAPVKSDSAASPKAPHAVNSQSPTPTPTPTPAPTPKSSTDDVLESIHGYSDDDDSAVAPAAEPKPNGGATGSVVYGNQTPQGFFAAGAKAPAFTTAAAAAAAAAADEEDLYETQGDSVDGYSGVEADVSPYTH